jgi:Arc/MetJ family transcription regulator
MNALDHLAARLAEHPEILFAHLFGSRGRGDERPDIGKRCASGSRRAALVDLDVFRLRRTSSGIFRYLSCACDADDFPVGSAQEASMRTTLNLDTQALDSAMKISPGRTKTDVINEALREYTRRRKLKEILKFKGNMPWEGDLDQLRKRESPTS